MPTLRFSAAALLVSALASPPATAQGKYDPGATDTEIKIGNFMPYTGAFSEYGATGQAEAAYFRMINDQGGINRRKINFISVDSGSDTGKSMALARQLVERVENEDDRREFRLRLTRKGKTLYEQLIPRLKRKEREIMSCLSLQEQKDFARLLGKIENSLDLVQTSREADKTEAY